LLYILEVVLFEKNKAAAIRNGQVHNNLTRNRLDYDQLSHNFKIYNSRPVTAGCKLCNKLPAHTKQTRDDQLFKKRLKELLLKGCYYSTEEYIYINDDFILIPALESLYLNLATLLSHSP
jgi:hypothetical protein